VCCQGAAFLSGNLVSRYGFCCRETCIKCVEANGDGLKTVISGTVVSDGSEQGVDLLLPTSPSKTSLCNSNLKNKVVKYPSGADVLTVLLLVLHPNTWFGIKDEGVKAEFQNLVQLITFRIFLSGRCVDSVQVSYIPIYLCSLATCFCVKQILHFFSYANLIMLCAKWISIL
jgi:hypothetical protein